MYISYAYVHIPGLHMYISLDCICTYPCTYANTMCHTSPGGCQVGCHPPRPRGAPKRPGLLRQSRWLSPSRRRMSRGLRAERGASSSVTVRGTNVTENDFVTHDIGTGRAHAWRCEHVQVSAPESAQGVHPTTGSPVYPALQRQDVILPLAGIELEYGGQRAHASTSFS